jgi:phage terminase large subunit
MKIDGTVVLEKNWAAINATNPDGTRKYRYIVNEGSSRSSKTYSLIDCYDLYARISIGKRLTVWRDTKVDCKRTVLNDILRHHKETKRYLQGYKFHTGPSIFFYDSGTNIEIHGTDDEETVHGLTQDAAWINEPYKISRDTFDQIDQRTSDFILLDWNPKKSHWIDDLKKDPRTLVIHSTFKDNPFCPPEQRTKILSYQAVSQSRLVKEKLIENVAEAKRYDLAKNPLGFSPRDLKELQRCRLNEEKRSADEYKWDVYGLGLKAENPHRIFHFTEVLDQVYHELDTPVYYGVDWGAVDPMGVLEAKYYDGTIYFHERNYSSENQLKANLTLTEQAQIDAQEEGFIMWFFNHLHLNKRRPTICDNNRKSKIIALRMAGFDYAIEARKWPGSVEDGIDLLNSMKVCFTASSTNFKYEQENYQRKVDNHGIVLDEPEDTNNHLMDPARYIAQFLQQEGIVKIIA